MSTFMRFAFVSLVGALVLSVPGIAQPAEKSVRADDGGSKSIKKKSAGFQRSPYVKRETRSAARAARVPGGKDEPLVELVVEGPDGQEWGSIVLELAPRRTPITVRNFLRYVDEGFYDGTIFHRVMPDFIIQGGQYTAPGEKKTEGLHGPIRNESRRWKHNVRGAIGMSRKKDPHTGVCQFYINVVDNEHLDYGHPQAGPYGHCVFGEVIEGMNVVERIAGVPRIISPAAQKRYEHYRDQGYKVQRVEKSLPMMPPRIREARRLDRAAYEERFGRTALEVTPPTSPEEAPQEEQPSGEEDEEQQAAEEDEDPGPDDLPIEE